MKKFLYFCAIAIAAAGNAAAAEPTADSSPQLVSDLQSTPAGREEPPVAGPCCAAGCAPGICGYCDPPWVVASVDALFMQRQRPTDTAIFINGNTGATLLNASQFDFGYETGGDANLTFNDYRGWGIDLRYEWLGDSSAFASYAVPNGLNYYNTSPPSYLIPPPSGIWVDQWSYRSHLQTVEINFRKNFERFDGLIGFRYADLSEQLSGVQSQVFETVTTTWNSQNNLYGLQIGAETLIWENPSQQIRIQGYGKAALCANPIETNFAALDNLAPVNPFNAAHASLTRAAFLGDLGVTASCQLTRHIALRGGYQMLWFDGVAVASRQVAATGNFNFLGQTTSHVDPASTVFYQGFKAGLEVSW